MRILLFVALASAAFPAAAQVARFDAAGNWWSFGPAPATPLQIRGPASRVVRPGQSTSFSVTAAGSNLNYRWFLNGVQLSGETRDTLLVASASAQQMGDYFVVVGSASGVATSAVARVEIDADFDGLGDTWEVAQFGSVTNQNFAMDRDNDGASNGLEYQDRTSPTNATSFLARLDVRSFGGRVVVEPVLSAHPLNSVVTLTAIPDAGQSLIGWHGALNGATNPASLRMTGNQAVQATFGLPLALALNTTLPISSSGAGGWFGQRSVSFDGEAAAAAAPPLVGSGGSTMETVVVLNREGTVSFRWRGDGSTDDRLTVHVNGRHDFPASRTLWGATGWSTKTIYLAAGTNRVGWTYTRERGDWTETESFVKPRDTAYVDQLVVTEYANPLLDSDGNSLPDLWEYRYFDRLGNDRNGDPDEDGIATRIELTDATNPNLKDSVKPRVTYTVEGQGTVVTTPAMDIYGYGQWITNTATPANGWRFMGWVGPFNTEHFFPRLETSNPSFDRLWVAKNYRAVFGTPSGAAVDAPGLTWTTSPALPWFGQDLVTQDGVMAASSALTVETTADTESWLETTVTGPGTLSFFWKASAAAPRDYLTLLVNSVEATPRLTGLTDWQPIVVSLGSGEQKLRWLFKRFYGYDTNASNTVWLDRVNFTAGPSAPVLSQVPASLLGYEGKDLTFEVLARGTPPLTYRVLRNGVDLTQPSTNPVITLPAVSASLSGNWVVRAQNAHGSVDSAPIAVDILALPANDDFAAATLLTGPSGAVNGYSIGGTGEDDEPSHGDYWPRASVWYRWTAPSSGGVKFSVVSTNPPGALALAAYRGGTLANLSEVAAVSVEPQVVNGVEVAVADVQWLASAGVSYSIAVDAGLEGASFRLSWGATPPPSNDAFANRIALTGTYLVLSGDTSLATAEPGEPPLMSFPPFFTIGASNTLWWSWTAPTSGKLRFAPQFDGISPVISMFTGSSLSTLNRLYDPLAMPTSLDVVRNVTYAISADSEFGGESGLFRFVMFMDALSLRVLQPSLNFEETRIELLGAPSSMVEIQFSPNLRDWYPWSTNYVPTDGVLRFSLQPPDPIPPAQRRFFRAIAR